MSSAPFINPIDPPSPSLPAAPKLKLDHQSPDPHSPPLSPPPPPAQPPRHLFLPLLCSAPPPKLDPRVLMSAKKKKSLGPPLGTVQISKRRPGVLHALVFFLAEQRPREESKRRNVRTSCSSNLSFARAILFLSGGKMAFVSSMARSCDWCVILGQPFEHATATATSAPLSLHHPRIYRILPPPSLSSPSNVETGSKSSTCCRISYPAFSFTSPSPSPSPSFSPSARDTCSRSCCRKEARRFCCCSSSVR